MPWLNLSADIEDMFSILVVPYYDRSVGSDPASKSMRITTRRSASTYMPAPNEIEPEERQKKRAEYMREYRARTDLKEKRNKHMREYRQRARALEAIESAA